MAQESKLPTGTIVGSVFALFGLLVGGFVDGIGQIYKIWIIQKVLHASYKIDLAGLFEGLFEILVFVVIVITLVLALNERHEVGSENDKPRKIKGPKSNKVMLILFSIVYFFEILSIASFGVIFGSLQPYYNDCNNKDVSCMNLPWKGSSDAHTCDKGDFCSSFSTYTAIQAFVCILYFFHFTGMTIMICCLSINYVKSATESGKEIRRRV